MTAHALRTDVNRSKQNVKFEDCINCISIATGDQYAKHENNIMKL